MPLALDEKLVEKIVGEVMTRIRPTSQPVRADSGHQPSTINHQPARPSPLSSQPSAPWDVKRFFKAFGPATLGSAETQLAIFADTVIARC